ncbi:polyphosphate--glucose phosphotransferase [Pseudactinotalea sp. Z1732]|uniref:polyphosphate--glucose phosphotransferase n=1 Tax=Micrococcales TaxID=85006 RepID=UPI003C7B649B
MSKGTDKATMNLSMEHSLEADAIGFGIDIGGSGIKGAPVNLNTGRFLTDRFRLPTPKESTPEAVGLILRTIVERFDLPEQVPVGVTFPGVVQHDVIATAANMHSDWVGTNLAEVVETHTGRAAHIINDADAAGYAEMRYGAAKDVPGVVLVLTLGTGIGSALIHNSVLVPNTELGHLIMDGDSAEKIASSGVKDKMGWSYEQWVVNLQRYMTHVELLFSPDLFVFGGGVSKDHKKFVPLLTTNAPIVPAHLRNKAGIIGAAIMAAEAEA